MAKSRINSSIANEPADNALATMINGEKTNSNKYLQEDPFWTKEAQTISELPKILSIFYNDDSKLRRISYILNYRDRKTLNEIIAECKKLLDIKTSSANPNHVRKPQESEEESDNCNIKWKLYNLNGQAVKDSKDLYFQFASSFLLCKKSVVKLPPVVTNGNGTSSIISNQNLVENKDEAKKITSNKIPFIHQSRPSSSSSDFLQRKNRTFKPHLSRQQMGWVFGSSNLKMDDDSKTTSKRKRVNRSTSPNSKINRISKPPIASTKRQSDVQTINASSMINAKTNSGKAKTTKKLEDLKKSQIKVYQRSVSADDAKKFQIETSLSIDSSKTESVRNSNRKEKDKKKIAESSKLVGDKTKEKCTTKNKQKSKENEIKENVAETSSKVHEIITPLVTSVVQKTDQNEEKVDAQPKSTEPKENEIISLQTNGTKNDRSLFAKSNSFADMFSVNIPKTNTVRRGSLPLKSWMVPLTTEEEPTNSKKVMLKTSSKSYSVEDKENANGTKTETVKKLKSQSRMKVEENIAQKTNDDINLDSVGKLSDEKTFVDDTESIKNNENSETKNIEGNSVLVQSNNQISSLETTEAFNSMLTDDGLVQKENEFFINNKTNSILSSSPKRENTVKSLLEQKSNVDVTQTDDVVEVISLHQSHENIAVTSEDVNDVKNHTESRRNSRKKSSLIYINSEQKNGSEFIDESEQDHGSHFVDESKSTKPNSAKVSQIPSNKRSNVMDELFPKTATLASQRSIDDEKA